MHRGAGFTLVEVLVATVILAAGMTAVLRAFSGAAGALDSAAEVLTVSNQLENEAATQELRVWPRREPPASDGGRWVTDTGVFEWRLRGESLVSTSNAVLSRVTLEAVRVGRPGRSVLATEWLHWRDRP